jgi:hypothetical protein
MGVEFSFNISFSYYLIPIGFVKLIKDWKNQNHFKLNSICIRISL